MLQPFVWDKKLHKEGLQNLSSREKKNLVKRKQESNKIELEKVKKQRMQREKEREVSYCLVIILFRILF